MKLTCVDVNKDYLINRRYETGKEGKWPATYICKSGFLYLFYFWDKGVREVDEEQILFKISRIVSWKKIR